jgi:hypothetical protein
MFAYNPTVQDRSGEIIADASANAANIQSKSMMDFGNTIGGAITSLAGGITRAISKSQANTAKLQGIQATGDALQAILPTYGEEGMALGAALTDQLGKAGTNPDKLAGAMMAFMPAVQNLQSRYNQQAQYTGALNLAKQKQALGLGGGGGSAPMYNVEVADGVNIY